mgnify:CR=1 FL=1
MMGSSIQFIRTDGIEFNCNAPVFVSTSQMTCTVPGFNEAIVSVKITKPVTATTVTLVNALTFSAPLPTAPVCFSDSITTIANDASNIYLGGNFTSIGSCMGGGIPISKDIDNCHPSKPEK